MRVTGFSTHSGKADRQVHECGREEGTKEHLITTHSLMMRTNPFPRELIQSQNNDIMQVQLLTPVILAS
jgi:hypothetical protein